MKRRPSKLAIEHEALRRDVHSFIDRYIRIALIYYRDADAARVRGDVEREIGDRSKAEEYLATAHDLAHTCGFLGLYPNLELFRAWHDERYRLWWAEYERSKPRAA